MTDFDRQRLRAPDPSNPSRRDVMSAGRTLVIIVMALGLAAIFNAGRQAERASQQPLGPDRDRALAIWEPIDAIASPLGLEAPRSILEVVRYGHTVTGSSDSDVETDIEADVEADEPAENALTPPIDQVGVPPVETTTTVPATTVPTTQAPPRVPTAAEPLRVSLVGDSTMIETGKALQRALADTGIAESILDARASSGFSRPDFYDWPAHLRDVIPERNPEVVVAMFGGNDAQGFVVDGSVYDFGSAEWITEYGDRVRGAMEYLVEDGRTVIWIGQPTMRSESFESKIAVINQIYQDQAALVEGVTYLDSRPLLSPNGYTAYGPGPEGAEAQLRASDGIHLTDSGGQVISVEVLRQLAERGFLPASP